LLRCTLKVLILNHQHVACGVYQFAKRIYTIASRSTKIEYLHISVSNRQQYIMALERFAPDFIIYNWHWDRMPWLLESDITQNKKTKHYFIYHDGSVFKQYDKYLFFGDFDPDKKDCAPNKSFLLPRPLIDYNGMYCKNEIPTIGSFGFGFNIKNFHLIVKLVNDTFDSAVVNLHMTRAYFGDLPGNKLLDIVNLCKNNNTNPNIKLNISTNFLSDEELLVFLASNDINIFYYQHDMKNPGISSAIDYALSVKRPIAITNNIMFRHMMSDGIILEKNSIQDIINNNTIPLHKYYDLWSTDNFSRQLDNLFLGNL
jgi:hypothetical protein